MFGLMKACSCNKTVAQRELRRMHYCGTCKTIGRLYSTQSRVFLNHDAVFLAEILSAAAILLGDSQLPPDRRPKRRVARQPQTSVNLDDKGCGCWGCDSIDWEICCCEAGGQCYIEAMCSSCDAGAC